MSKVFKFSSVHFFNKFLIISFLLSSICIDTYAQKVTPQVVEIIAPTVKKLKPEQLMGLGKTFGFTSASIYQWENHTVAYGNIHRTQQFYKILKQKFPDCEIKLYNKPFYDFNRTRCSDSKVAKEWDNIILTANLVADPKLQQEYLNYHATQFEKWPEVSQGFCNASFQQLLVFKNGRQLMLIISIPKGESLDKLNPLTTKDNPRVDEWNKIMAKYQEGIEGTKKGETWVFLKKYRSN